MARATTYTRSRIRSLLQEKGVTNIKTLRQHGMTKVYNEDGDRCIAILSDLYFTIFGTYEVDIPIHSIDTMRLSIDFPYLTVRIFTKVREYIEFHIPAYNENER